MIPLNLLNFWNFHVHARFIQTYERNVLTNYQKCLKRVNQTIKCWPLKWPSFLRLNSEVWRHLLICIEHVIDKRLFGGVRMTELNVRVLSCHSDDQHMFLYLTCTPASEKSSKRYKMSFEKMLSAIQTEN